jgi:hypothetical protein
MVEMRADQAHLVRLGGPVIVLNEGSAAERLDRVITDQVVQELRVLVELVVEAFEPHTLPRFPQSDEWVEVRPEDLLEKDQSRICDRDPWAHLSADTLGSRR